MGLEADIPLREVKVDTVFVGSCTNGRIEDLRTAAAIIDGRHVDKDTRLLVVPVRVRLQAEEEGLDVIFKARRRVARRRLLDVPGHEPRPAHAGGAQRLHVQPQLRGSAGQGRSHLVSVPVAAATAIRGTLSSPPT